MAFQWHRALARLDPIALPEATIESSRKEPARVVVDSDPTARDHDSDRAYRRLRYWKNTRRRQKLLYRLRS